MRVRFSSCPEGRCTNLHHACSLPDSPRYFVKRGNIEKARAVLVRLRGQPGDSKLVQVELAEIVANAEVEERAMPTRTWYSSWLHCFKGSVWDSNSNLRRTILGTSLQMMQQWTGVNFMCAVFHICLCAWWYPGDRLSSGRRDAVPLLPERVDLGPDG